MKIIILPLYGMGDVLMSTPALRNIKERIGAHITYLHMFKPTMQILEGNPYVDENIHFPFLTASKLESFKFFMSLRGKFDASINFYPSNRKDYNIASYLINSPLRIGHRYTLMDYRELNFLKNRTFKEDDGLHNVEEDLRLTTFLGIKDPTPYPMGIYLSDDERGFAGAWLDENGLKEKPYIGFHPGSSVFKESDKKRWPTPKFAELIQRLSKLRPDLSFLLFGGPEENQLKDELRTMTGLPEKTVCVNTSNIRQTVAIMQRAKAFVSNDSGLMHISAALQVPTVALFGPTNPKWLHPWMCKHIVIRQATDCGPCFKYSPLPQQCLAGREFGCLRDSTVDEVYDATVSFIS